VLVGCAEIAAVSAPPLDSIKENFLLRIELGIVMARVGQPVHVNLIVPAQTYLRVQMFSQHVERGWHLPPKR
jgi:hypothetical protein